MKTILASSALAFALLVAAPAFASPPPTPTSTAATSAKPAKHATTERNTVGVVKAYDAAKGTLKLANGQTYRMGADIAKQSFSAGQKVDVRWTLKNQHRVADRITLAK